ncbi:MAG: DCC1-like thiol-disulfide oxidoreductase family protein [Bacteroidales bacterium]
MDALINLQPIVLFDGYCNLCSGSVVLVLKREWGNISRFASLQSDVDGQILSEMVVDQKVPV